MEEPLRWRLEVEGEHMGSESESEDEMLMEGEVSLKELNRHVSTEEQ